MDNLISKLSIAAAFEQQHNMEIYAELKKLRAIDLYANLMAGVYGEVREVSLGKFEIEIKGSESYSGYPVLFNFEPKGKQS